MSNLIRGLAATLVLILAAMLMPGCESNVSDETFDQITTGMTYDLSLIHI